MIDSARLLSDLQGELTTLVADLRSRVDTEEAVREPLEAEYAKAFDAGRTGRTFAEWSEERLTQVAVGWLLGCVFVRFCEDNGLIDDARIGGAGARGVQAKAAQQDFFAANPHLSDRDYLHDVFRRAAALPGLAGVVGEGSSPLWLVDPSADACTRLVTRFRAVSDDGVLVHDFADPSWSTRFLGDLYQDLSSFARETYALLQTPDFVEEFILDRTLDPALETFGLAATKLIDPTCGSGHFLLGAFDRLWRRWQEAEPATSERVLVQRALDGVWGVDLNPFAAAIARFRLLLAALRACGVTRLADAPNFRVHVTVGDSLLWGAREGQLAGMEAATQAVERQYLYATEHADELREVFGQTYAAVVGNPPYIIARDKALNQAYRDRFGSCSGKYSLGVPFTERFWELATPAEPSTGRPGGHVGMITANSFMKRSFGREFVERYIPNWDVTHVIDTSGAYIPGHGTPTVILFGRNQRPVTEVVRSVMGIRGEPSAPADPAKGLVWQAIVDQVDVPGSESDYISVADTERTRFSTHPWSIGGGGATELKEHITDLSGNRLRSVVELIGVFGMTNADDAMLVESARVFDRRGVEYDMHRPLVTGGATRDWKFSGQPETLFPYRSALVPIDDVPATLRWLWPHRAVMGNRMTFAKLTYLEEGRPWWEWHQVALARLRVPTSIAVANIATHNHFVLDRGGKAFNRSAPVIKLPAQATMEDHLGLLGLLNCSVSCFWAKQVLPDKGNGGIGGGISDEEWERRFVFDPSKLQLFPLPAAAFPVGLAARLDAAASDLASLQPSAVAAEAPPLRPALDAAHLRADEVFAQMIAWQEELDWTCLHLYGLTDEALVVPEGREVPPLRLGERAFEIILARKLAAGEVETAWFTRHRSTPITEVPSHWPDWYRDLVDRRIALIEADRDVGLVERPEHKRRWARTEWEVLEEKAQRGWLLDRLEDRGLWFDGGRAVTRTVRQLADRMASDEGWMLVAREWAGSAEADPTEVVSKLVADEHVPAQSAARYTVSGLTKRAEWERVWDLQRAEDRGEDVGKIAVPPKYAQKDFAKASFWKQRGKLDVPKERFTSVPGAERDGTAVLAWAGFDHAELAQALATALLQRQTTEGWQGEQLVPLLVALSEVIPWVAQWHPDVDPSVGRPLAAFYDGLIDQTLASIGATRTTLTDWRPPAPTRGRKKKA